MHRTEGDGYVLEGGLRRFKDRNLPTYIGTIDTAEYNNAVQEEICSIIETLGGTVAVDAATDRTAGWHQLYDLIFQSEKITDAAISDFDLAKAFGEIAIGSGGTTWVQDLTQLRLDAVAGNYIDFNIIDGIDMGNGAGDIMSLDLVMLDITKATGENTQIGAATIDMENVAGDLAAMDANSIDMLLATGEALAASPTFVGVNGSGRTVGFTNKGLQFLGGPGSAVSGSMDYRQAGYAYAPSTWLETLTGSGVWSTPNNLLTSIPFDCQIISVSVAENGTLPLRTMAASVIISNSGGFVQITEMGIATGTLAPSLDLTVFIEYDARPL